MFFRLCNDPELAQEVVRLDGLSRLVELCKKETARVGSDGVLVACLAAVRKIASIVGPEHFQCLDASELVEPRLLDSFLIFSSKNESFVWIQNKTCSRLLEPWNTETALYTRFQSYQHYSQKKFCPNSWNIPILVENQFWHIFLTGC